MQNTPLALRVRLTRFHARFIVFAGSAFSVNTLLGAFLGRGMYPFLHEQRLAAVGLLQAYLLMAVIGIALLRTCREQRDAMTRGWHGIAALAHVPPMLAVALFASTVPEMTPRLIAMSFAIHLVMIAIEAFAATRPDAAPIPADA